MPTVAARREAFAAAVETENHDLSSEAFRYRCLEALPADIGMVTAAGELIAVRLAGPQSSVEK